MIEPLSPVKLLGTSRDTRKVPFSITSLHPLHLALAVGARDVVNDIVVGDDDNYLKSGPWVMTAEM